MQYCKRNSLTVHVENLAILFLVLEKQLRLEHAKPISYCVAIGQIEAVIIAI